MRKLMILGCILILCISAHVLYAQDEDTYIIGEIRELLIPESMIQVGERNYEVALVLVDAGGDVPVMGSISDLAVKDLVKVYVIGKGEKYWMAEKVIVFKGAKRDEVLKESDLSP